MPAWLPSVPATTSSSLALPSPGPSTTAPAASPNSTQVDRSFHDTRREMSSTPTTSTFLASREMRARATSSACTKPAHPLPPRS